MKTFDEAVEEVIGKRLTNDLRKALVNAADIKTRYGLGRPICENPLARGALEKVLIWVEQEPEQTGPALVTVFELGMAIGMEMEKGETLSESLLREEKER